MLVGEEGWEGRSDRPVWEDERERAEWREVEQLGG